MKKVFILFVLTLVPMLASADAVEIDGIYYNLVNKTKQAEVTGSPNGYSGEVVIPTSVTYEDEEYSVTSIGEAAFKWCYDLTSITIPNSVTNIGGAAFDGCIGLTSITIPNSVTSIGDFAFAGCPITSITIPNSVTNIGGAAFSGCSSLTSVMLPCNITSINYSTFHNCSSLTSIIIPGGVTDIWVSAFEGCTGLTSITIPNSVTSIWQVAFNGCTSLTSITIGSGIQTIYGQAFANCHELTDVYCYAEKVPSMIEGPFLPYTNAFENSHIEYATLHVPVSAYEAYSTTEPWSQFGTIKMILKCATPSISYSDMKLSFSSETEGVEYVYDITDTDIKHGNDAEVSLTATYEISVYATKAGYENSDVATATLVWSNAIFTETTPATAIAPAAEMEAPMPILIQNNGGTLTIQGAQDGTPISVYTVAGMQAGTAVSQNSRATISTSMQQGDIAIIKIGERSVKIVLK